jgi:hypothetical protein
MTRQSTAYEIPRPAPSLEGSGQTGELLAPLCTRCGAVGTHYLTCPGLRLPPGYRLSEDSWPGEPGIGPGFRTDLGRPRSGPDHPDWPRRPRR